MPTDIATRKPRSLERQVATWARLRRRRRHLQSAPRARRGPVTHVILFDGTLSSLDPGRETNIGLIWRLLAQDGPRAGLSLWYEAGVQWCDWRDTHDVIAGRGINAKIERAYGFLASRYRPGDKIYLLGYSRGAFAVRSLAGMIDQVGLLRAEAATERKVAAAYRLYRHGGATQAFAQAHCYPDTCIEMVGVFDTVKALGVRLPILWRLTDPTHAFHSHALGPHIKHGYQALAFDERREAFAPELWERTPERRGPLEQRWFPGTHPDVGGQLGGRLECRPFSNLALVWMLSKAEAAGLALPEGWRTRFPTDATAPGIKAMSGWGKFFLFRRRRATGLDPSETFHPALAGKTTQVVDPVATSFPDSVSRTSA